MEAAASSPSCQVWINPKGKVEVLSTHEQVLDGCTFLGCKFPCNGAYREALLTYSKRVGEFLAKEGVKDRFAVDFVAVKNGGGYDLYCIEINIRWGGTTHPFMQMAGLVPGYTD